jgi:hypothetical protein
MAGKTQSIHQFSSGIREHLTKKNFATATKPADSSILSTKPVSTAISRTAYCLLEL